MVSLNIFCSNPFSLKNKIMKTENKQIFCGTWKILKNISWPMNICLKYFLTPTKTLRLPSYILNVQSLRLRAAAYLSKNWQLLLPLVKIIQNRHAHCVKKYKTNSVYVLHKPFKKTKDSRILYIILHILRHISRLYFINRPKHH